MHGLLLLALLALPANVLALGSIRAAVTDGVLEVTGDDEANVFRIAPGTGAGALVVTAFEGTTVNDGVAPVAVAGVNGLKISTGAGDDRMELVALDLAEKLLMKLGRGVDDVILQDVRVQGKTQIKGGKDRDVVTIRGFSRFRGQMVVETGKGSDEVTLTNATLSSGIRIDAGGDGDSLLMQFCALDPGEEMVVRGGSGEDLVTIVGSDFFDDVEFDLGNEDDDLRIEDCDFDEEFEAEGGDGDDELDFDGTVTFEPLKRRRIVDFEAVN